MDTLTTSVKEVATPQQEEVAEVAFPQQGEVNVPFLDELASPLLTELYALPLDEVAGSFPLMYPLPLQPFLPLQRI
ncbi:hypothetical protein SLEP1_g38402 [Rubroshorea leprosula]|nr:hypothetical protein SLEP1_g38402 [Rubroshorea leprosula]